MSVDVQENAVPDSAEQQAQVADTSQGETTLGEATETTGEESDSQTSTDDAGEESQNKPKKGFEKRISKVVAERDRAKQELEYWKEHALRGQVQQPEQQAQPVPEGKPIREQFNGDDDAYFEALSDWKVESRLKQRDAQVAQAQLVENYATRAKEFAKERPDFFDIINDANDLVIAPETGYIIQKSEAGPKLALYLAENSDENDRLNRLNATERLYELGKLESRLTDAPKSKAQPKKVSTAPQPLQPVKGAAPVSKDLYDPNLTTAEWIALRSKKRR
jgi:hypothetical protein